MAKGTSLDERYLFNYMCELFEIYIEKRRKTAVSCHIIFVFLCRKNFLSEQKSTLFLNNPRIPSEFRIFTGDTSCDIYSPGPVIWEVSP